LSLVTKKIGRKREKKRLEAIGVYAFGKGETDPTDGLPRVP